MKTPNQLLNEQSLNDYSNTVLNEGSKYSKLMRILRGTIPHIRTFGIVTAENPMGKKFPSNVNKDRNNDLKSNLVDGKYTFKQIIGKYGTIENPFIIYNISKDGLIEFAEKYEQESVIFGYKTDNGMSFDYVETKGGEKPIYITTQTRNIFIQKDNSVSDFYSQIGGRKFKIPFFEDDYEDASWDGGKIIKKENIQITKESEKIIQEINDRVDSNFINGNLSEKCGYSGYGNRGMILTQLNKLKKLYHK